MIVTAGAESIPEKLLGQLKTGGMMVVPVGSRNLQKMFRVIKTSEEGDYETENHGDFVFVPLLKGKN
jgi:protein-L-isoaspartate(D-aspartate) O-methyltransferase